MRRRLLLAVAGGVVCALSVPPFGWWPLGPLGLAVLVRLLRGEPWRRRVLLGFAWGAGMYGVGLAWAWEFTAPGTFVFVAMVAAQTGLGTVLVPPGRGRLLGFPAAFTFTELFRSVWPFGGLPLSGVDLGQAAGPLAPSVALGGRLLLTAVVAALAVALAAAWEGFGPRRRGGGPHGVRAAAPAAAALAAAVAVTAAGWTVPKGHVTGSITVAVVQGGGERGIPAENADERAVFEAHLRASRAVPAGTDVTLWPEDVVDVDTLDGSPEDAELSALARAKRTTLVVGVVDDAPDGRFFNFAAAYGPDGRRVDEYQKVHRVPFGEYFPFRSLLERVASIPARDAVPGPHQPGLLHTPAGRLGVLISYEVFFQGRARSAVGAGGSLLLVPTNASSYTTTQMPDLEVAAARLRALQTGRDVAQAAPTGFSAFVDHDGRVTAKSDLGRRQVLHATLQRRAGDTPHTRTGDAPTVVVLAALLVAATHLERQRLKISV